MPYFKTAHSILFITALAIPGAACAQETAPDSDVEVTAKIDHFATSDINADGTLDRYEFIAYVNARAEGGEIDYISMRDSGNLDAVFKTKDANSDGMLDRDEVESI